MKKNFLRSSIPEKNFMSNESLKRDYVTSVCEYYLSARYKVVLQRVIFELCAHENVAGWRRRPIRRNNLKNKGIV